MDKPEPCPFCGGEVKLVMRSFARRDVECKVACDRCQVYMVARANNEEDAKEMAILKWNRRA